MSPWGAPPAPEVEEQSTPEGAQSVFQAQGIGGETPQAAQLQGLLQSLGKVEQAFTDFNGQVAQTYPPLMAYSQTAALVFIKIKEQIKQLAQRSGAAQGSPVMPQAKQVNPGAGPPNPAQAGQ